MAFWEVFGALGNWAGGAATAGSILLGVHILRDEQSRRSSAQSNRVVVWTDFTPTDPMASGHEFNHETFHVLNNSDQPLFAPVMTVRPLTKREFAKRFHYLNWLARRTLRRKTVERQDPAPQRPDNYSRLRLVLYPGSEQTFVVATPTDRAYWNTTLFFTDATGRVWIRDEFGPVKQ